MPAPDRSTKARNPYLNRVMIRNASDFYGRRREVAKILARIGAARPQSVAIVGERRIGKSSLLHYLCHPEIRRQHLDDPEAYTFVLIDLQEQREIGIPAFFENVFRGIEEALGRARPPHLPADYEGARRALLGLQEEGRKIILLFDEFDAITRNPNFPEEFFAFLRAVANKYDVAYVTTSGRDLQQLCHADRIADSPFFNIFSNLFLTRFEPEEALALIRQPSEAAGIPLAPYATDAIDLGGLFPFFVQVACSAFFEHLAEGRGLDLGRVRASFLEEAEPHFKYICDHLDEDQRRVLKDLAEGRTVPASHSYLVSKLKRDGYLLEENGRERLFSSVFVACIREGRLTHGPTPSEPAAKPDRRPPVSQLDNAVLEGGENERAASLNAARGANEALHQEVESLLAQQDAAASLVEAPTLSVAARTPAVKAGAPIVGQRLAHYRILDKIGAGGMGEVYRAHDDQLDRDVAIKVLPAGSFGDPTARARLLREARAAAALNHPYICTIHEVGEADGHTYIAMELVEGESLSARMASGPLPPDQMVRYGLQLADALAHAHERGVVHRDLKSANVVITPEGWAKVLDFGLAKQLSGAELAEATTQSQTSLTQPGTLMGTLAYMAPEQFRGQPADARSDVWALGVVLYEMTAGARPFQGKTSFELSSAILNQAPAPLPVKVPAAMRVVIERCFEKEPGRRYQRASEVHAALEAVQSGGIAPRMGWRHRWLTGWRSLALGVVALVLVLVASFVTWTVGRRGDRRLGRATAPRISSLAVLPLENLSGDSEQEYFADGMTETLITNLAQLNAFRVISRTSVLRFKSSSQELPEIARALGVDAIVEGSVLRDGDRVRISTQLIDARTDQHLWARSFDRDLREVLALQSEVAQTIAAEIGTRLERGEQQATVTARPVDSEAHDAYLRGRYYWNKRTEADLKRAVAYFEQAIAREPGYALAHSGLADSYESLGFSFDAAVLSPQEAMPRARSAAMKALELDEASAKAHTSLAFEAFLYEWDPASAEQHFRRALELNPQYANAHHWYSHYLMARGRVDESQAEARRALELDPLNFVTSTHLGWHYLYARDPDRALETLRRALEMDPSAASAALVHRFLGFAYEQKGRMGEAIAEMEKTLELREGSAEILGELGYAYAVSGRPDRARGILRDLEARSKGRYTSPYFSALVYAGLGHRDRALAKLDRAVTDRSDVVVYLEVEPRLDSLRSDPRFTALVRRVGLGR